MAASPLCLAVIQTLCWISVCAGNGGRFSDLVVSNFIEWTGNASLGRWHSVWPLACLCIHCSLSCFHFLFSFSMIMSTWITPFLKWIKRTVGLVRKTLKLRVWFYPKVSECAFIVGCEKGASTPPKGYLDGSLLWDRRESKRNEGQSDDGVSQRCNSVNLEASLGKETNEECSFGWA